MMHVTLDGSEMISRDETHQYLKSQLNIIGYYRNNLDSLWDALSTTDHTLDIRLIHAEQMLKYLGDYGKAVIAVFDDAAKENSNINFSIDNQR